MYKLAKWRTNACHTQCLKGARNRPWCRQFHRLHFNQSGMVRNCMVKVCRGSLSKWGEMASRIWVKVL